MENFSHFFTRNSPRKIRAALISVFHKNGLEQLLAQLSKSGVELISTGGTYDFIKSLGHNATRVEDLTSYPAILGGRVKTLHPKVFGGILQRRDHLDDKHEVEKFEIPQIDLVVVDLYPFKETFASGAPQEAIIEKIDIGGVSLIRAAAKNFRDVAIVCRKEQYPTLTEVLQAQDMTTSIEQRQLLAGEAFEATASYDSAIAGYFNPHSLHIHCHQSRGLRYGENPHQKGRFYGNLDEYLTQIHGKELSYNNLLDLDAAVQLMSEFRTGDPCMAILKHNNPCGLAVRSTLFQAWTDALAGDPVSAFGGVIISSQPIDEPTANSMNELFFEVLIAPGYTSDALAILQQKKNRVIIIQKKFDLPGMIFRSALNGILNQDRDLLTETHDQLRIVTKNAPTNTQKEDLLFANKIAKHTRSNTIILAGKMQLYAGGTGQTSRIDAMKQAIEKARHFGFDLRQAVLASDAFFPFADSVEVAYQAGIRSVIQPGGSVRDQDSIDFCNQHGMNMIFTGIRHFKH